MPRALCEDDWQFEQLSLQRGEVFEFSCVSAKKAQNGETCRPYGEYSPHGLNRYESGHGQGRRLKANRPPVGY